MVALGRRDHAGAPPGGRRARRGRALPPAGAAAARPGWWRARSAVTVARSSSPAGRQRLDRPGDRLARRRPRPTVHQGDRPPVVVGGGVPGPASRQPDRRRPPTRSTSPPAGRCCSDSTSPTSSTASGSPSLHGKRDLIPGHDSALWIEADRPGVYRGFCAEFCGYQHAHMGFLVIADPPDALRRLVRRPAPARAAAGDPARAARAAGRRAGPLRRSATPSRGRRPPASSAPT